MVAISLEELVKFSPGLLGGAAASPGEEAEAGAEGAVMGEGDGGEEVDEQGVRLSDLFSALEFGQVEGALDGAADLAGNLVGAAAAGLGELAEGIDGTLEELVEGLDAAEARKELDAAAEGEEQYEEEDGEFGGGGEYDGEGGDEGPAGEELTTGENVDYGEGEDGVGDEELGGNGVLLKSFGQYFCLICDTFRVEWIFSVRLDVLKPKADSLRPWRNFDLFTPPKMRFPLIFALLIP